MDVEISTTPSNRPDGEVARDTLTYTPTEMEAWRIARVENRVNLRSRLSTRWAQERGWYENILFVNGHQWLDYSLSSRQFVRVNTPGWFPKITDNQLAPRARRLEANLLKRKPSARVRPGSSEPADREAARAAEFLLAHIDDIVREDELRQRGAAIVVPCGTVISKEWWNAEAGPEISYPETSTVAIPQMEDFGACPVCGVETESEAIDQPCPTCGEGTIGGSRRHATSPNGVPMYEGFEQQPVLGPDGQPIVHRSHPGDIESDMLLPFSFYLDEHASSLRRAEWCCEVTWRPLEWIRRNFPEQGQYVQKQSGIEVSTFYESALLQLVGQGADRYARSEGQSMAPHLSDGALFYWYEERPTAEFPEGQLLILSGGVQLHAGPLPIPGEFSFSEFQYWLVPGRFFGETPMTPSVPLQRRINGILSQLVLNRKTMLNPVIIAPSGCGLKPDQIIWRPGAYISYNFVGHGTAPQIWPGTPLPAQVFDELKLAMDSMDRICATEEVTGGDAASQSKSGIALAQLNEAAETTHTPLMQRWEQFIADRGRKRLLLAERFYSEKRKVKVLGESSAWTVTYLAGADIRGNTDVVVEAGSSLPRSRQAVIQLIMDLLEIQVLDRADPRVRAKILEEVGLQALGTDLGPDRRKALEENAQMDQGMTPEVTDYEDMQVHLVEHLAVMKDPAYAQKPPQAQAAYMAHVQETRMRAIEQMKLEMAAAETPEQPGTSARPEAVDRQAQGAENTAETPAGA